MLAIGQLSNTVEFVLYAIALVAFALGAIGISLHEKVSNLVALGLFFATVPLFWPRLAAL